MPTVKERLLRAGVRLAGLLNIIFALRSAQQLWLAYAVPRRVPFLCRALLFVALASDGFYNQTGRYSGRKTRRAVAHSGARGTSGGD